MIENNKENVKVVIKNYPLSMHQYARSAAAAALTADSMGKFWEFHEALYKNMKELNDEKIREIVSGLGLDPDEFEKKMESGVIQNKISQDRRDGDKAGLNGTPSVYVNGKLLKNTTVEGFQDIIDAQLKKLK